MIDKLQRIAQAIQILRLPSFIGLLWAISTYSFITAFSSVPEKLTKKAKFFRRVKRNLNRASHWILGVVYLATTLAAISLTFSMVAIWLKDYGG